VVKRWEIIIEKLIAKLRLSDDNQNVALLTSDEYEFLIAASMIAAAFPDKIVTSPGEIGRDFEKRWRAVCYDDLPAISKDIVEGYESFVTAMVASALKRSVYVCDQRP
jgi:hypothetical protein